MRAGHRDERRDDGPSGRVPLVVDAAAGERKLLKLTTRCSVEPAPTMLRIPIRLCAMRDGLMMQPSEITAWSICAPLIFEAGRKRGWV